MYKPDENVFLRVYDLNSGEYKQISDYRELLGNYESISIKDLDVNTQALAQILSIETVNYSGSYYQVNVSTPSGGVNLLLTPDSQLAVDLGATYQWVHAGNLSPGDVVKLRLLTTGSVVSVTPLTTTGFEEFVSIKTNYGYISLSDIIVKI